jgi:hypothetical protein
LFLFANYTLILALDAAESKKHIFFETLATDANNKKCCGKFKVNNSINMATLRATYPINRHFLISSSKFLPYLLAKNIPPS